jgi:hypothetical protein
MNLRLQSNKKQNNHLVQLFQTFCIVIPASYYPPTEREERRIGHFLHQLPFQFA